MTAAEIVAGLVKGLVWEQDPDINYWSTGGEYRYSINSFRGGFEMDGEIYPTLAAAQAAAEQDYRARIAAALDVGKIVALVEALDDAAGALDSAGAELSDFANVLSRDPWQANHAYESAVQARAATAAFLGGATEGWRA